jgi:DNA-binding beta-propeller fold protein YncE
MMGGVLYVADTGNHLLRGVDPGTGEVSTLAGTGELGRGQGSANPREPRQVPLRSPWGLMSMGEQLLVAMAGTHQIWVYDPSLPAIAPWAGSGVEDHIDGPLKEAAFAQPSGLARAGQYILVADSEVSSVRAIDLQDGIVRTVVGRGLFDFGDEVGAPDNVMLQHPLDVAAADGALYVADSYNNKIKAITFGTMQTRLVFGDGSPEVLGEPGGIAAAGGVVFIADTNNHRILRGDPVSGELTDLRLQVGARGPRRVS